MENLQIARCIKRTLEQNEKRFELRTQEEIENQVWYQLLADLPQHPNIERIISKTDFKKLMTFSELKALYIDEPAILLVGRMVDHYLIDKKKFFNITSKES